MMKIAILTIAI
jgi:hypothetical protein